MLQRTLNLGILAHVDAGKTTLTERLLYAAGVIDTIGRVDDGTTQTDTLALERQRGITIKTAVMSFTVGDVTVNLIDTPGHPDFIAEVERVLSILDGAVLVVSAVEGVQAQTPLLFRALQRLEVPTLFFVNKVDRPGASIERTLAAMADRLTPALHPCGTVLGVGTTDVSVAAEEHDAEARTVLAALLAEHDDALYTAYVDERGVSLDRLRRELAIQTARGVVHPVFFGSARTGVGADALTVGAVELLPTGRGDAAGPLSGTVFKVERGPNGERVAYLRLFSGAVRMRDRVHFGAGHEGKVTALSVFDRGPATPAAVLVAGQIGKLQGLTEIRVGDTIGEPRAGVGVGARHFAAPFLETVIVPADARDKERLRVALNELAEHDPLIDVRQDDERQELSVSLYGEVQKEVIEATLESDYGIAVVFRETTTICVERTVGSGAAIELLGAPGNPYLATVGLRVDPVPPGTGVTFDMPLDVRSVPLYVYKAVEHFVTAQHATVRNALEHGLYGWRVVDCGVTMTACEYAAPGTGAGDYRKLTPRVLRTALEQAGTTVCEPVHRLHFDVPAATVGAVLGLLARSGGEVTEQNARGSAAFVEGLVAAADVHALRRRLPGLTGGQGTLESVFAHYRPVAGEPPYRLRRSHDVS